jgi:tRNA A-37 threonylcarbamoyl transferase component Bud32
MWPLGATVDIVSGVLVAALGALALAASPRHQHNRLFALFAVFWGAQIVSANVVRVATTSDAALISGEVSLAFLLPLYFFVAMFAAVFPRPRAPFGTSGLAVALLLVPAGVALAALFLVPSSILVGVAPAPAADGGFTMLWGPAIPLLAALLYASFFYALFAMMRRLREAETAIERRQIALVLAALALYVAANVPAELARFGLGGATEAQSVEASLIALVMLAGLALLVALGVQLARERRIAVLAAVGATFAASGALALLEPGVEILGVVRIASVALVLYGVARYQLFDIDLKVKHAAAATSALLGVVVLAAVAWILLRGTTAGPYVAVAAGLVAFLPLWRVASLLADRVAPAVTAEGDHLYLRKLEVYRASVETVLREGRAASLDDAWLAETRARLGLSERDHRVVVSLAASRAEPPSAAPDLAPGSVVFGKYEVQRLLGEGGYGRVWSARDKFLGRAVVLKELQARWRADPRVVRTFLQEARVAGELDHPHVVKVYAVEQHGEDHYIVMEHVAGGTLAEKLGDDAKLPRAEALRIARAVLSALDAAHARGVVHRDVKPSNVLLGAKGEVKLADFGIAQVISEDPQRTVSGLTTGSHHPGTLQSMSPEQARGRPLDARSDLYAVGALLHRMLTGRPHVAVAGLDEFSARSAIANAPAPAPTGDREFDDVLARALAPAPEDRYATAAQMLAALPLNRSLEAA